MNNKDFSGIRNNGPLPETNEIKIPDDIGDILDDYIESTSSMLDELEQAALAYETGNNRQESAATIKRILHKISVRQFHIIKEGLTGRVNRQWQVLSRCLSYAPSGTGQATRLNTPLRNLPKMNVRICC